MTETKKRKIKNTSGFEKILDSNGTFTGKYKFEVSIKGERFRNRVKARPGNVKAIYSEWVKEKEEKVNSGPDVKLFDKLDEFLDYLPKKIIRKKKISEHTLKNRKITVRLLKVFFSSDKLVKDVTRADIEDFIIFRRTYVLNGHKTKKKIIAESTINIDIEGISCFFNYCIDRNYYKQNNPASRLKSEYEKRDIELSQEQRQELFEKANDQMKVIVAIGMYSGLRRKEICGLEWKHINFEKKVIFLPGQITKGSYEDSITIPDILLNILQEWRTHHPQTKYVINFQNIGIVTLKKRMDNFYYHWRKFTKQFDFDLKDIDLLHFHDLRHEFANDLLFNGASISLVQRQMRHKSPLTTDKYITNKKPVDHEEIKDKLTPIKVKIENQNRQEIGKDLITSKKMVEMPNYISRIFQNIEGLRDYNFQHIATA